MDKSIVPSFLWPTVYNVWLLYKKQYIYYVIVTKYTKKEKKGKMSHNTQLRN